LSSCLGQERVVLGSVMRVMVCLVIWLVCLNYKCWFACCLCRGVCCGIGLDSCLSGKFCDFGGFG